MCSYQSDLFSGVRAWLLGTAVLITSLVVHTAARPYEDEETDWVEFLTLIANLLVLVSGPVFTVLRDSDQHGSAETFRTVLVNVAALVMVLAIVATAWAQHHVWKLVYKADEDYKLHMVKQRLADCKTTTEALE